jgi:3-oxoacyl-[acyl-carrier-protein] synthase II
MAFNSDKSERRVVITGMGCVSPLGCTLEETWNGMKEGRSGIRVVESMDVSDYDSKIAGEVVGFDPKLYFKTPKDARRSDRVIQFAVAAAKMAMDNSGLDASKGDPTRIGTMIGSGIGGLGTLEKEHATLLERGPGRISPFLIPMMISNMPSGIVSIEHGLQGPSMAIVTACATANHSIGEAWRIIKFGDADAFVCGGTEAAIRPTGLGGFCRMRALSTRNDDPQHASRPFDVNRDGFVMGEGSGVVVIEELGHAQKRGAHILAELVGYGLSTDAHHLSAPLPDGSGAARAIEMALGNAGLTPGDVDYLNAHATSTGLGDIGEVKAIRRALGDRVDNGLMVSSTKSVTGHMLGAAGGVELIAAVMSIVDGVVPPTMNLEEQDPECNLDCVPNTAREADIKVAMSSSFGFGGHNATMIVKRFEG